MRQQGAVDRFQVVAGAELAGPQVAQVAAVQLGHPVAGAETPGQGLTLAEHRLDPQLVVDDVVEQGLQDVRRFLGTVAVLQEPGEGDGRPGHLLLRTIRDTLTSDPREVFARQQVLWIGGEHRSQGVLATQVGPGDGDQVVEGCQVDIDVLAVQAVALGLVLCDQGEAQVAGGLGVGPRILADGLDQPPPGLRDRVVQLFGIVAVVPVGNSAARRASLRTHPGWLAR